MPCGFDRPKNFDEPFPTKVAAELVEVSAKTLMHYENLGLVLPRRHGKIRLYSSHDIKWLRCFREMIHGRKISIEALKKRLKFAPCWQIKNCHHDEYADCVKSSDKRFTGALVSPTSGDLMSQKVKASSRKRGSRRRRV